MTFTYLGEGTVVPEVALVGETVADEAQLALLGVLLDGVEELLLGDLGCFQSALSVVGIGSRISYLLLGVGPTGDLDNHVQNGLLLIGVEGDVVERRDGHAILLNIDTVLQRKGLGDLADGESHGGRCGREMPRDQSGSGGICSGARKGGRGRGSQSGGSHCC